MVISLDRTSTWQYLALTDVKPIDIWLVKRHRCHQIGNKARISLLTSFSLKHRNSSCYHKSRKVKRHIDWWGRNKLWTTWFSIKVPRNLQSNLCDNCVERPQNSRLTAFFADSDKRVETDAKLIPSTVFQIQCKT